MAIEEQLEQQYRYNEQLINIIGSLVETRNLESRGHVRRMKTFTYFLASEVMNRYPEFGLDEHKVRIIAAASALHDMGKIAIPDSILFKPARLTREEFDEMKTHTTVGAEMLESITGAWDEEYKRACIDICRWHHEKYDGKGYPDGLVGDDIPLSAQIVSIVDIYDALVCVRVYKDAFKPEQAYKMILSGECGTFNPKIMECFKNCGDQFEGVAIRAREAELREADKK